MPWAFAREVAGAKMHCGGFAWPCTSSSRDCDQNFEWIWAEEAASNGEKGFPWLGCWRFESSGLCIVTLGMYVHVCTCFREQRPISYAEGLNLGILNYDRKREALDTHQKSYSWPLLAEDCFRNSRTPLEAECLRRKSGVKGTERVMENERMRETCLFPFSPHQILNF